MSELISIRIFNRLEILDRAVNFYNHKAALKNISNFPQLAIFSFDHIGLIINQNGAYERDELKLVECLIKKFIPNSHKTCALDIGANIGNHSIFFSSLFYKVISFEPNPIAYEVLSINAKYASKNKNVIAYNFGLSDNCRSIPFKINPINIGASRIDTQGAESENTNLHIQVKIADQIDFLNKEEISLIKIDVEGHEYEALRGAENIIKSNKPFILFEQGPEDITNGSSKTVEYIQSLDYRLFTIKRSFDFGQSYLGKAISALICSIFGKKFIFIETKKFDNLFYDMILAVPNDR